jgi:adhesin/invasin
VPRPIRLLASVVSLVALACPASRTSDASSPPTTSRVLSKTAGDAQSATAGQPVSTAPAVKVATSSGAPVSGVAVTFSVPQGSGSVTGASQTTDLTGVATVGSWTLGQTAGPNSLVATAAGVATGSPATFSATGVAGAPAALTKTLGDGQQGSAGQNAVIAPTVTVKDQFGNPVSNVAIVFAVASGGGSVTGASQLSGANGTASVAGWKLGNATGSNTLSATATGSGITGNPALFTATGVVGPPALIAKTAGDNQAALAGAAVAIAPTVKVTDAVGNNVSGAGVTFAPTPGVGSVTGGSQLTAPDGTAKPSTWTLGSTAGPNTLTATATASGVSGSPLTFTATAGLNAAAFVGNWNGNWTNTTFGSSGTTTLVIAQGSQPGQVTITHSGTGTVLGGSGAPAETRSNIPYAPAAFTLQTVSNTFGNVTLNVDATGAVVGSGTQVPNAAISRWDCTGTISPTQIRLNFTVTFTAGGTAVGSITITKQ